MNNMILMSIKTKHANKIFNGTKIYEYRRKSIGINNLNKKVFIYSSEIDKSIIGYVIFDKIIEGTIEEVLSKTNSIDNMELNEYFKGLDKCYALHIKEYYLLKEYIKLIDLKHNNVTIPQFYRYIKEDEYLYSILKNY